jgi:predicted membrane protein
VAVAGGLPPTTVFDAATLLVMPFYAAMVAAPKSAFTRRLMGTGSLIALAGALYGLLLVMWNPLPQLAAVVQPAAAAVAAAATAGGSLGVALRAALPSMPAFAALFGSPEITALAWVHLVLLDLVQAR